MGRLLTKGLSLLFYYYEPVKPLEGTRDKPQNDNLSLFASPFGGEDAR